MKYRFPKTDLLHSYEDEINIDRDEISRLSSKIIEALEVWDIGARLSEVRLTPLSICFEMKPRLDAVIKNIKKIKVDVEVRVGHYVEIIEPNDKKETITVILIPNSRRYISLKSVLESEEFLSAKSPLSIALGVNYNGDHVVADIEEMPHMLIAGTTGSGKTVFLDDIIMSILFKATPDQVKMILIDPKLVDFTFYNRIPHLLAPVVYEESKIFAMFDWVETEIMKRYDRFSKVNVKNIHAYNEKAVEEKLPQILVIIDEYCELMKDFRKDVESMIDRIARLGRAAGVHLIIATQRPTADVVTGSIKNNLPCRASFTVVDSREASILNLSNKQRLGGNGDMLFSLNTASGTMHAQAPYISLGEIISVVDYIVGSTS